MKIVSGLALGLLLLTGSVAHAQRDGDRGEDRHEWGDRAGFQQEWGQRGADWDHNWRRGEHLPDGYWRDRRYVVDDYDHHHLPPPRRGYHWVRYGEKFVMTRDRDGSVLRVLRDVVR